jgi:aerobic C4-dicarboxylate transport protein
MNVDAATIDTKAIAGYTTSGKALNVADFILGIIPRDVVDAFAKDDVLQVVFFSVLFGVALAALKSGGAEVLDFVESVSLLLFRIMAIVMRVAPLGAFGAMAFTVAKFGPGTLLSLGGLIASFYATGFFLRRRRLRRSPAMDRPPNLPVPPVPPSGDPDRPRHLVFGDRAPAPDGEDGAPGCSRPVVGPVAALGYSFNLAGTAILPDAGSSVFIAQATNTHVGAAQGLQILPRPPPDLEDGRRRHGRRVRHARGDALLAVAGTCRSRARRSSSNRPVMSEARALTNLTETASRRWPRWEGELDFCPCPAGPVGRDADRSGGSRSPAPDPTGPPCRPCRPRRRR